MRSEQLRIVDDPKEIDPERWKAVSKSMPGFRIEVFRSLAEQSVEPRQFRIFVIEDDGGIHAAAVCQLVGDAGDLSPLDSLLFGRGRKLCDALRVSTRPYLSFFLPLGGGTALSVREAAEEDQRRWLGALFDGIERHAEASAAGIAFVGIARDALSRRVLVSRGYLETEARPTTFMSVEWDDIDGYIAHLRRDSANAANTVRYERSRSRKLGVVVRKIPVDEAATDALYAFASDHYRHKNGLDPVFAPDFFSRLAAMTGDDFLLFEARRNGTRTALLGALRSEDTAWITWVGFDKRDRQNDFTYFNLAFYLPAEYAASAGIRTLLYGNSVYGAKLRRGCRMVRCGLLYRPDSALARGAARPFFRAHRAWYRRKFR